MRKTNSAAAVVGLLAAAVLTSCASHAAAPVPASETATSESATLPNNGAPKVENPLPAKVLDDNPCDSAFTSEQLTGFLGQPTQGKADDTQLGPTCDWHDASGSGAGILVGYETKTHQGLSLTYKNSKPKASRWVGDMEPVQGYPAVGYVNVGTSDNRTCVVTVGISDELAYSISLSLGDSSVRQGKDACEAGHTVADAVMTNIKARA